MLTNKNRGIVLIATKYPYYGRMAYNLAMTIKAIDKNTNITVVHSGCALNHIRNSNMWLFDDVLEVQESDNQFLNKLWLHEYTPYNETIFIDADCIWINRQSPNVLFDQLADVEFTGITEGFHDFENPQLSDHGKYYFWADVNELQQVFNLTGKLYQWRSEFIYFKCTDKVINMFNNAQHIYNKCAQLTSIKKFADTVPDELIFNLALNIHNIQPHIYKWQPSYWNRLHNGNVPEIEALQKYFTFSCGSNVSEGAVKRIYDRVVKSSAYKLGLQHVFPLVSKKESLVTRQKM